MSNRLADSHSPYLLQHQDNPVQWYPWGEEAFAIAAQRQRPIFLSVGYAACHWCHVMERESFENEALAELLNEHFVSIKVDREERPDVDQIYMNAVQMMTGHGGWPMSVFLTPDRRPFFGGTYWPPSPRAGMPGFEQVLRAVADAWENRREEVLGHADQITDHLTQLAAGPGEAGDAVPEPSILDAACERLQRAFDREWGGFGQAPKFPHASDLELLLRRYQATGNAELLQVVTVSLDAMANGGIYDHLGGGFARYSVDRQWLVPHFEKMLYDNALLAGLYVRAALVTGSARYRQVARETLRYIVRDLTDASGGFHSSEDADSEGEEGLYYVWTPEELHEVLGAERAERFAAIYDVTPRGNFEGRSILHLSEPIEATAERPGIEPAALREELETDRAELLARRETRVRPGRDDKVLVAWNALAIESLALGGRALGEEEFVAAAERCARFLLDQLRDERGRLLHAFRRGTAHLPGFLDDYTNLIDALVTLYEATGRGEWIAEATRLGEMVVAHFQNRDSGGFYYTADDHEALIVRTMDWHDSSMPSGNGSAAHALLRLARLTDHAEFEEAARRTLVTGAQVITRQTAAAGRLLAALDLWHAAPQQIVLSAPDEASLRPLTDGYFSRYRPSTLLGVVIGEAPENGPVAALLQGKEPVDGQPAAYVCQNFRCTAPVVGTAAVLEQLGR